VPTGKTRLTCSLDMAVVFIESFRRLAEEAEWACPDLMDA
jgi:hypothetical protein